MGLIRYIVCWMNIHILGIDVMPLSAINLKQVVEIVTINNFEIRIREIYGKMERKRQFSLKKMHMTILEI